jgi:quinol monooxygenase YgiN
MWGMIAKITVVSGKRSALAEILSRNSKTMPGCLSYIVAEDSADENVIWVSEAWQDLASHDNSLTLPSVQEAIRDAKPLVAGFEKVAITHPVGGVTPPSAP